jgi:Na+/H+-translocating membrane pyrophosphatase
MGKESTWLRTVGYYGPELRVWSAVAVTAVIFAVVAFGPLQWYYTKVGADEARAAEMARLHEAIRKCGDGAVAYVEARSGGVLCAGKWIYR